MKYAIGLGCRKGCAGEAIEALVRRAAEAARCDLTQASLFTHVAKSGEDGLFAAARRLGAPLVFLPPERLRVAAGRIATRSARVEALFDLPSIAESAALAGAGPGARLLVARINGGGASCAIAARDAGNTIP